MRREDIKSTEDWIDYMLELEKQVARWEDKEITRAACCGRMEDERDAARREAADYRAAIEDWAANCGLCRCRDVKELLARYSKPEEQG